MVAELIEKPLTEAQRIVQRLETEFSMGPAAIAREIKLKTDTIDNIRRRRVTGNLQLARLRRLIAAMETPPTQGGEIAPQIGEVTPDLTFTPSDDPATLALNSEEPAAPAPKKGIERAGDWLRAAIYGSPDGGSERSASAEPANSAKRKAKASDSSEQGQLVEQLVPLAALALVVSGSLLIPDPYKAVGPTNDEATAMVYPIIKRAVRELDARKRISESTMDAVAILLAVGAYGVRAHGTWQAIHVQEVERARSQASRQPGDAAAAAHVAGALPHGGAAAPAGDRGAHPVQFAGRQARERDGRVGDGPQRRADPALDALLRADAEGRARLGIGG
jgi:hypothetical protein